MKVFICYFGNINMNSWFPILFSGSQDIIIIIYFDAQTCFRFVQWRPFKLASVNSWHIPIILEYVLVFWHKMMFQVPFAFSLPKLNSAISPRNPSSSKWRIIVRSQVWRLSGRCTHCYRAIIICRLSWWTELRVYVYTFIHISYTHIFMSISKSINMYWKPHISYQYLQF